MKRPITARVIVLVLAAVLLALTPLLHDAKVYRPFRLPKEMFSLLMSAVIGAVFIIGREPKQPWLAWRALRSPLLPGWLAVAWAAAGPLWWSPPGAGWPVWGQLAAHALLLTAMVHCIRQRSDVSWLLGAFLLPLAVSGGYAILQFYGLDPWFAPLRDEFRGRWLAGAWIGQPTLLGGALGPAIPLLLTWLLIHRGVAHTLAAGAGFVLALTGLMATHTRAVVLALLILMPLHLFLLATRVKPLLVQRRRLMFTLFLATCAVLLPFMLQSSTFVEKMSKLSALRADSAGARLFYWRVAAAMVVDEPVAGHGLGSFAPVFYDYQIAVLDHGTSLRAYMWELVHHAHNEFVQIAAELGAVGAFLCFWFIAALVRAGWKSVAATDRQEDKAVLIGCLAAAGVLLIDALFSFPFHIVPSAQGGLLLAALLHGNWIADGEGQAR